MDKVSWKSSRATVLAAVKRDPLCIDGLGEYHQDNEEIVLAAIEGNASALEYASARLRGQKNVVLAAVKHLGSALRYASDALRVDEGLVLEALMRKPPALQEHSLMNDEQWAEMVEKAKTVREKPSATDGSWLSRVTETHKGPNHIG